MPATASVPWPAKLRAIVATTAAHAHQTPTPRMEEKIMNCSSLLQKKKKKKKKAQEESAATAETTNGFCSETRLHTQKVRERRGGREYWKLHADAQQALSTTEIIL